MEKEKRVYARDQNWRIGLTLGLGAAGLAAAGSRRARILPRVL